MEEFKDFEGYLIKCESSIGHCGIFKVKAPDEWVPRAEGYDSVNKFQVKKPIEQNVHGKKGIYELVYFIKESRSLDRFRRSA